ncbi:MAG TPA: MFS transporter [Solirubrobacterales bacterium]|nr:MFS transporter [Solirubrobacterales bacterium]
MTRDQRLTLIATILGTGIVFLDSTVVNVALPAIQRDLDTGLAGQQWVVEAYLLALVALLLVGGSLGDLYGRRRLFSIGLFGFAVTSVLCAIAPNVELLIAARALQGCAGALLVPGSLAILAATFEGEARGRAVGVWTAWAGISTLIGPAAGGLLIELDWRWIFWINVPLLAATIWVTRIAVSESSDPEACPGIDGAGIVLSAVGLGGPILALIEQPTRGWGDPLVWAPLAIGIAALVAFVWWESHTRAPMLELALFRIRNFLVVNLATLCVYASLMGGSFFLTIYLQQVSGYTPFEAGAATTPITILMFFLSSRFGALAGRIGPRLPMGVGPLIAAVGVALLVRVDRDPNYLTDVLPALIPFGVGLSVTVAPLTTTVLDSVPERQAGIASGANNAVSRIAGLLAIAALGAVISGQFTATVDEALPAGALSAEAAAAVEDAKAQPLAGANGEEVPAGERATVVEEITSASESAFATGIWVSAALMALGGLISLAGVRNPEHPTEPEPENVPRAAPAGECGRITEAPALEEAPAALSGAGAAESPP